MSCKGDSGGPLVRFQSSKYPPRYELIGVLYGGEGECGNDQYPGIYARLENEEIFNFLMEHLNELYSTKPISSK